MIYIWLSIPHIIGEQGPPAILMIKAATSMPVAIPLSDEPVDYSIIGGFEFANGKVHTVSLKRFTPSVLLN